MLQFPVSFDKIAERLYNFVGMCTDKRVETKVQITYMLAKFDVLYELPHFYRNEILRYIHKDETWFHERSKSLKKVLALAMSAR